MPRGSILGPFWEPKSTKDRSKNRYDEPSGSWSGPWGPGWVSEGSCGDFGVGSGAPGLDFELHVGSLLGAKNRHKFGSKIGAMFALILGRFLGPTGTPKGVPCGARLVTKMASDFETIFGSVLEALSEAPKWLPCVTVRIIVGSRGRENHGF